MTQEYNIQPGLSTMRRWGNIFNFIICGGGIIYELEGKEDCSIFKPLKEGLKTSNKLKIIATSSSIFICCKRIVLQKYICTYFIILKKYFLPSPQVRR